MRYARHTIITLLLVVPVLAVAQDASQPTNDAPNNYTTIKDYFKLPEGRTWGSTSAVDIDKDGKSIWVAERCGAEQLSRSRDRQDVGSADRAEVRCDRQAREELRRRPADLPARHLRRQGRQRLGDRRPGRRAGARRAARGAGAEADARRRRPGRSVRGPGATHGNQVFKFSPDGKVLLTLGKPGGAAAPDYFYQPNDVITAPNGDIFVSEGHGAGQQPRAEVRQDRQVHQGVGQDSAPAPANSISRTRSRSTRRAGCSSATATTTACRSSIRTASSSRSARSSAGRAASSSRTTSSTSPIPNPNRSRATTTAGSAASAWAA